MTLNICYPIAGSNKFTEISLRKYSIPNYLAFYLGKYLPHRPPAFSKMTDSDYITVLSWCEDWTPEEVYNMAYKQSHLDHMLTWDEWSENMQSLPLPVRAELQRAITLHMDNGNLQALRAYAFFYEGIEKLAKYAFWVFIATTILLWIGS